MSFFFPCKIMILPSLRFYPNRRPTHTCSYATAFSAFLEISKEMESKDNNITKKPAVLRYKDIAEIVIIVIRDFHP